MKTLQTCANCTYRCIFRSPFIFLNNIFQLLICAFNCFIWYEMDWFVDNRDFRSLRKRNRKSRKMEAQESLNKTFFLKIGSCWLDWLDLPTELWLHIFSFLPQQHCFSRKELSLTCHRFHSIVQNVAKCQCYWCRIRWCKIRPMNKVGHWRQI